MRLILREFNGVVEVQCDHGVGHPHEGLCAAYGRRYDGMHGCDGCCGSPEWIAWAEQALARRLEEVQRAPV